MSCEIKKKKKIMTELMLQVCFIHGSILVSQLISFMPQTS